MPGVILEHVNQFGEKAEDKKCDVCVVFCYSQHKQDCGEEQPNQVTRRTINKTGEKSRRTESLEEPVCSI